MSRALTKYEKKAFVKQIAIDERAIKIDTQRSRGVHGQMVLVWVRLFQCLGSVIVHLTLLCTEFGCWERVYERM